MNTTNKYIYEKTWHTWLTLTFHISVLTCETFQRNRVAIATTAAMTFYAVSVV